MKMVTEFMVSLAIWLFGAYRWISRNPQRCCWAFAA